MLGSSDTYAQDSIDMLSNSAGIDFSRSQDNGIDQNEFGELLITSGLVLLEDVTWITFTGYLRLFTLHPNSVVGIC